MNKQQYPNLHHISITELPAFFTSQLDSILPVLDLRENTPDNWYHQNIHDKISELELLIVENITTPLDRWLVERAREFEVALYNIIYAVSYELTTMIDDSCELFPVEGYDYETCRDRLPEFSAAKRIAGETENIDNKVFITDYYANTNFIDWARDDIDDFLEHLQSNDFNDDLHTLKIKEDHDLLFKSYREITSILSSETPSKSISRSNFELIVDLANEIKSNFSYFENKDKLNKRPYTYKLVKSIYAVGDLVEGYWELRHLFEQNTNHYSHSDLLTMFDYHFPNMDVVIANNPGTLFTSAKEDRTAFKNLLEEFRKHPLYPEYEKAEHRLYSETYEIIYQVEKMTFGIGCADPEICEEYEQSDTYIKSSDLIEEIVEESNFHSFQYCTDKSIEYCDITTILTRWNTVSMREKLSHLDLLSNFENIEDAENTAYQISGEIACDIPTAIRANLLDARHDFELCIRCMTHGSKNLLIGSKKDTPPPQMR